MDKSLTDALQSLLAPGKAEANRLATTLQDAGTSIEGICHRTGEGVVIGLVGYGIASCAQSLRSGTNLDQELHNRTNYAIGVGTGLVAAVANVHLAPGILDSFMDNVGAGFVTMFPAAGLLLLGESMLTNIGILDHTRQRYWSYVTPGAALGSALYTLAEYALR